ncbi:GNAT family N-acetyltransferase [Shewanella scandinavica]|uniref:GNAT family N-acetyltransferase n=1 Tax=Shewanella scandinavica TaxID=3063538 RepID=UPI00319D7538
MTTYRHVIKSDVAQVVAIHLVSFQSFFLTSLGPMFLEKMYESFMTDERCVFVVAEENDNIVGFSVGVSHKFSFSHSISYWKKIVLALSLTPVLLSNMQTLLPKIISRYKSEDSNLIVPDKAIFLKSIGVLPNLQGRGIANELITYFEQESVRLGYEQVLLTTDINNNDRVINFYKKSGYLKQNTFIQDKLRTMLVLTKDIRKTL